MSDQNDQIPDSLNNLGQKISELDNLDSVKGANTPSVEVERKPPGILTFLPPLIQEIWHQKVDFNIESNGAIVIDGFYKNGSMKLTLEDGKLIATDKRNRKTEIKTFEDLVELNYSWWKMSISRTTYVSPGSPWLGFFVERKKVTRQVIYRPIDENEGEEN